MTKAFDDKRDITLIITVNDENFYITITSWSTPNRRVFFRVDGYNGFLVTNGKYFHDCTPRQMDMMPLNRMSMLNDHHFYCFQMAVWEALVDWEYGNLENGEAEVKAWLKDLGLK